MGGMTRMPAVQEAVRKIFGREPHKGVNPDEVVAVGAAIQAGVLGGEVKDILLLDVTPADAVDRDAGRRGHAADRAQHHHPDAQEPGLLHGRRQADQVEIHVVQGERPMAADNKTLGKFILDGIPPAPRGVPQIEVTFDIDADGILKVSAKDKATGRSQHITITASSGLTKEEVERHAQGGRGPRRRRSQAPRGGRGPQHGRQRHLRGRKGAARAGRQGSRRRSRPRSRPKIAGPRAGSSRTPTASKLRHGDERAAAGDAGDRHGRLPAARPTAGGGHRRPAAAKAGGAKM